MAAVRRSTPLLGAERDGAQTNDLERENQRLRALVDLSRATNVTHDLRPLLSLIARHVVEYTGGAGALAAAYDADLSALGPVEAVGLGPDFAGAWARAARLQGPGGETELRQALLSRRSTVYRDIAHDERLGGVRELEAGAGVGRATAVPLIVDEEMLGLLVAYFRRGSPIGVGEESYVAAVADQAAAVVRNAWLYAQLRRELRRRDALRQVVAYISSELDLAGLLERVVQSAVELLDATGGSISLVNERGEADMRAVYNLPEHLVGAQLGPGEGITGQVLATRAPVVVGDYMQDLPGPLPRLDHLRASLAVPIWWQGQLIGVFAVFDSEPNRAFHEQDRDMMELLANHVAIAIENARLYGQLRGQLAYNAGLYTELQGRLDQIVSLQRLSALVLQEHDFDRVLQTICEQLLVLTEATGVGLALLEENGRYFELRTVVGPSASMLRGARVPVDGSFAGEAVRTNQPLRSSDAPNDPRGYKPSLVLGRTRTILSVPMKTRQRTVGAISIYNKKGGGAFTDRDAELATLFANQAAVAIENARLYEQAREFAVVEERNRLARELHDSVTQSLFSVTLLSQAALSLWDRDAAKARERVERATELAQGALAEMRALIFQLRPMALQEEGLISALRKYLAAFKSREGVETRLEVEGPERRLPTPVEEAVFRVVQESLNNVAKHAQAQHATVRLTFDTGLLEVCTEDDGIGFNPGGRPKPRSLGMASMRERAEAVGGILRVESEPGRGTRVYLEVPVPAERAA